MKELRRDLENFTQHQWNEYVGNIIFGRPFTPKLPEHEDDPTLILLALYSCLLELKIETTLFNRSIKFHYIHLEKSILVKNQLSTIITVAGFTKPDLYEIFTRDFTQRLLQKFTDSSKLNLHILLIDTLSKYYLSNKKLDKRIKTALIKGDTRINTIDYDYTVMSFFLTAGLEKDFFEYLFKAFDFAENKTQVENIGFALEKYLYQYNNFDKIFDCISFLILNKKNGVESQKKKLQEFIETINKLIVSWGKTQKIDEDRTTMLNLLLVGDYYNLIGKYEKNAIFKNVRKLWIMERNEIVSPLRKFDLLSNDLSVKFGKSPFFKDVFMQSRGVGANEEGIKAYQISTCFPLNLIPKLSDQ